MITITEVKSIQLFIYKSPVLTTSQGVGLDRYTSTEKQAVAPRVPIPFIRYSL